MERGGTVTMEHFENRILRPIRVFTEGATLDGLLNAHLDWRTQDELNIAGRPMLTISSPLVVEGTMRLSQGPLQINKSAILFATEIPDLGAELGSGTSEPFTAKFDHSVIRLELGGYDIEGYVYTTRNGDAMTRLNLASHPFIALTMTTITGRGIELRLPFVAVNRFHVVAAQELFGISMMEEGAAGSAS